MRTHIVSKLLVLGVGGGLAALMFGRRQRPSVRADLAPDPSDPVQSLNELQPLHLEDLEVDAMSLVDGDVDIDTASLESALGETAQDAGELYGVQMSRTHPEEDDAMGGGQNWIEALGTSAAEQGPAPEQPLDSMDEAESDSPPRGRDTEDTPIADLGSGGPGGM